MIKKTTTTIITVSSALVRDVGEALVDKSVVILIINILVTKILDAAVVLLVNVAVTTDIKGVVIIVGRICVESVMLVDETAKVSENQ